MRISLKMNINVRELSSQCFICEYSASILRVFYGYSMGILWVLRVEGLICRLGGRGLFVNYIQFLVYFYET